jgi:type I restriction enzyme R subunit
MPQRTVVAGVREELIALAKQMRTAGERGVELGLSEDELALYDALETNDSAAAVLGEPELLAIARELTEQVRANVTIDWTVRENVRAQLRAIRLRPVRPCGARRGPG